LENAALVHHSTIREFKNANAAARRPQIGYRALATPWVYKNPNHHNKNFFLPVTPLGVTCLLKRSPTYKYFCFSAA
jgi:hypothetical protein